MQRDTVDICDEFTQLVLKTSRSFEIRVGLKKLIATLTHSKFNLTEKVCKKVEKAESVPEVIFYLDRLWSWFNYHLLEDIINDLGDQEDRERLAKYKQDFAEYSKMRVVELPSDAFQETCDKNSDQVGFMVKVDRFWENYYVRDADTFCNTLASVLGVRRHLLHLVSVRDGCVLLSFSIPLSVARSAFPLSLSQKKELGDSGVMEIECDGFVSCSHLNKVYINTGLYHSLFPACPTGIQYLILTSMQKRTWLVNVEALQKYLGADVHLFSSVYAASEGPGIFGVNEWPFDRERTSAYTLQTKKVFYEFIPQADVDANNPKVLLAEETEIGEVYEIVITTTEGLYRYRIGDLIKVLEFSPDGSPVVDIMGRTKMTLSLHGEKLQEFHLTAAMSSLCKGPWKHHTITDFTVTAHFECFPPQHNFWIEVSTENPSALSAIDLKGCATFLMSS